MWAPTQVGTNKDQESVDEGFYKVISNSTRRRIIMALHSSPESTFSEIMHKIGLHPTHDTGAFNYHLKQLIEARVVTSNDSNYGLTKLGHRIAATLPAQERYEVFSLKPTPSPTRAKVIVEEKEEEGLSVPRPDAPWPTGGIPNHAQAGPCASDRFTGNRPRIIYNSAPINHRVGMVDGPDSPYKCP